MLRNMLNLELISSSIRMATPLIFAAIGSTFIFSAGVINIALEGSMIMGSLFAVAVAYWTNSLLFAFLAAGLAGMFLTLLLAILVIKLKTGFIVAGLGANLLAWGITVFVLEEVLHMRGAFIGIEVPHFIPIRIGIIESIPLISQVLSGHILPVYLSWFFCFFSWIVLFKTPLGLKIRAIGEYKEASRTLGINVEKIQILFLLVSGFSSGLGGAYLSIGSLQGVWSENMIAGRGFIALCALAFGKNNPISVFIGCLLFGFADAIGIRFQMLRWQPSFVQMIPYIFTIIILWVTSRKRVL